MKICTPNEIMRDKAIREATIALRNAEQAVANAQVELAKRNQMWLDGKCNLWHVLLRPLPTLLDF